MKKSIVAVIAALTVLLVPSVSLAAVGVGIGTGKIRIDEKLNSGMTYNLPVLTVINTGDEVSTYKISVTYHQDQKELAPPEEWFTFTPDTFELKPGASQEVSVRLKLPIETVPGDYFAYLEAAPTQKTKSGNTTIGIAAATKLNFAIAPSNVFIGIYYWVISTWKDLMPWSNIAAGLIAVIILSQVFAKFFNLQISVKGKHKLDESYPVK